MMRKCLKGKYLTSLTAVDELLLRMVLIIFYQYPQDTIFGHIKGMEKPHQVTKAALHFRRPPNMVISGSCKA